MIVIYILKWFLIKNTRSEKEKENLEKNRERGYKNKRWALKKLKNTFLGTFLNNIIFSKEEWP